MSSTFECSRNDLAADIGVMVAAGGVALFASPWPDIVIGGIIALIFLRSVIRVTRKAGPQCHVHT